MITQSLWFHKVCITANGNETVFPPYRYFLISRKHLAQGLLKVTVEIFVQGVERIHLCKKISNISLSLSISEFNSI